MTMNPKERLLGAVADLQRFVIHHPDEAKCPVCPRWDELQGAAMQAVTAIDDHEAELAALRAELAVLRNNQLGPVPEGPLKALGAWVADHTDDDTWPTAERLLNAALAEMEALRAERAITASPWRYKEWGGLVVGGGEGSAEVLICTMATNTRHDEGRHNRELIVEAPTLRARLDKAEAEAARLRAWVKPAPHRSGCMHWSVLTDTKEAFDERYGQFGTGECTCGKSAALGER